MTLAVGDRVLVVTPPVPLLDRKQGSVVSVWGTRMVSVRLDDGRVLAFNPTELRPEKRP